MPEEKEKRVSVFNMSKVGRPYDVPGFKDEKGERQPLRLPAGKATDVPEEIAKFLLGKRPNGVARYHDLLSSEQASPEASKAKNDALAENKKLMDENAALRKQLADLAEPKEKEVKGGKK